MAEPGSSGGTQSFPTGPETFFFLFVIETYMYTPLRPQLFFFTAGKLQMGQNEIIKIPEENHEVSVTVEGGRSSKI